MAKSAQIILVTVGSDIGPLIDLYSDSDCFTYPIQQDVPVSDLLGIGYTLVNIPDNATKIRVQSKGTCTNYSDLTIT